MHGALAGRMPRKPYLLGKLCWGQIHHIHGKLGSRHAVPKGLALVRTFLDWLRKAADQGVLGLCNQGSHITVVEQLELGRGEAYMVAQAPSSTSRVLLQVLRDVVAALLTGIRNARAHRSAIREDAARTPVDGRQREDNVIRNVGSKVHER